MTRIAGPLVLLTALLCASPAVAREQTPKQRARVLFKQANQLFSRGMYLDALQRYRKARSLYPSFKIDLNIGATLDSLERRTEAAEFFERFLLQSATAPAPIIKAASTRLDELRKKLGRIKVTSLVEGATLWVDGKAVGKTPIELPVYLEPGQHTLRLEREGHETVTRGLEVAAGVYQTLDLTPRPRQPKPTPASHPALTPPVHEGPDPAHVALHRRKTLWAYSALGVGAALTVTAAVLYGVGASQGSSAHDAYSKATDPDEMDRHYDDVEAAKTKLVVGHVLMGVAAVAYGVSAYQFLTRPGVEQPGRAHLSLRAGRHGGVVGLRGTF